MRWPEYLYGDLLAWAAGNLAGLVILVVAICLL